MVFPGPRRRRIAKLIQQVLANSRSSSYFRMLQAVQVALNDQAAAIALAN